MQDILPTCEVCLCKSGKCLKIVRITTNVHTYTCTYTVYLYVGGGLLLGLAYDVQWHQ